MLHGTFYKMEKETFHELVSVSQDFENSLEKENTIVDELVEGVSSGDESDDGILCMIYLERAWELNNYLGKLYYVLAL